MNYRKLTALLLCTLLLASCGTKKHATSPDNTAGIEAGNASPLQHIVQNVNANRQDETFATAKASLTLAAADKSIALSGTLRMKRNDVIQISLTTFGILEVARIEVTPDYFMAVDKMGRQYVKAAYDDVSFLKTAGISFHTLQALFWDELFLLASGNTAPTEKQFKKELEGEQARLTNADSRLAVLTFLVDASTGIIRQTTVAPHTKGASPYLTWDYAEHANLGNKSFPTKHLITVANGSKPIKATLSLSNLRNDSDWETRTNVSSSYKEITVDKLLSRITNLSI
ncbi:MAG: DUF4292 domain-containing protein [Bacteroidaceae bacterium]|nr:DUF4292 domain-containing protein [Bacteroidaceae bacterium]